MSQKGFPFYTHDTSALTVRGRLGSVGYSLACARESSVRTNNISNTVAGSRLVEFRWLHLLVEWTTILACWYAMQQCSCHPPTHHIQPTHQQPKHESIETDTTRFVFWSVVWVAKLNREEFSTMEMDGSFSRFRVRNRRSWNVLDDRDLFKQSNELIGCWNCNSNYKCVANRGN